MGRPVTGRRSREKGGPSFGDDGADHLHKFLEPRGREPVGRTKAHGHAPTCHLFLADHRDVRRPPPLRVADPRRQSGVPVVYLSAHARRYKRISYPPAVSDGGWTYRHDHYLNGSQPHGQRPLWTSSRWATMRSIVETIDRWTMTARSGAPPRLSESSKSRPASHGLPVTACQSRPASHGLPVTGCGPAQSGWSSPTICRDRRRCSPEQLSTRWALPSGSVVHLAGFNDPCRIVSANAPSSPGTAIFTRTVVPSAKRSRAARGTGAASMTRGGTPRCTSGCRCEDSRRAKSRRINVDSGEGGVDIYRIRGDGPGRHPQRSRTRHRSTVSE